MKLFSSILLLAGLVLGNIAYGQDPAQTTPPAPKPTDVPKMSVTGCLTKGTEAAQYLITDQGTGQKIPFSGPSQLDKYVNQTVKLTGAMVVQGQEKVFKPESVNQVASTCEKGQ